jgi:hypothetical protein
MSIFYVSAFSSPEVIESALKNSTFPYIEAIQGQWIISFKGTSEELSNMLGISDNKNGLSAIVLSVSGYWGFAPNNLWEFMTAHWND